MADIVKVLTLLIEIVPVRVRVLTVKAMKKNIGKPPADRMCTNGPQDFSGRLAK